MKSNRSREIQVGVMVVLGIIVLIGGLMFFKRVNLKTGTVIYAIDFPAVEGLRKGDRVQVRGIRVGNVTDFEFLPGVIRTHIEIEDWVELHPDAEAVLVLKGLVGEVLIEIEPGQGDGDVLPGHVFIGRNAASMLALGDKVNEALDHLAILSEETRLFISQLRVEGQIVGVLAGAERTILSTQGMIEENRASLRRTTTSLANITETLDAALAAGQLDSTLIATRMAAVSFDSAMVELRETIKQARGLLARVEAGEGTVGRLFTDESLYDQADSTMYSLHRLIDRMRRDPKAMFKMSVF